MEHSGWINRIIVVTAFVGILGSGGHAYASGIIAIITDAKSNEAQDQVVNSIKQELSGDGVEFKSFNINGEGVVNGDVSGASPSIVVTLGVRASLYAVKNLPDIPAVFSMVLDPVTSGIVSSLETPGKNASGIMLDIPFDLQFNSLKKALPKIKTIGMLYDAKTQASVKNLAAAAAEKAGLSLDAKPVYTDNTIKVNLEKILSTDDCLWAQLDARVYNAQTLVDIIKGTIAAKKPFFAFSAQLVKAGALLALERDYADVGRQTGEMVRRVLNGTAPGTMPVEGPRSVYFAINAKTADAIGAAIASEVKSDSKTVKY
jgi:putative ABC transport system substrate-binding protein